MSIASDTVTVFRTEWADRFVDTCDIADPLNNTDRGVMDPDSYQYDEQTSGVVYTGACLLRPTGLGMPDPKLFGQQAVTFVGADLYLPFNASEADLDQQVTITASVTDTLLVGTIWTVRAIIRDSYNTRRRLQVELDLGTGLAY